MIFQNYFLIIMLKTVSKTLTELYSLFFFFSFFWGRDIILYLIRLGESEGEVLPADQCQVHVHLNYCVGPAECFHRSCSFRSLRISPLHRKWVVRTFLTHLAFWALLDVSQNFMQTSKTRKRWFFSIYSPQVSN